MKNKDTRILTVESLYWESPVRNNMKPISKRTDSLIRLKGQWLINFGFTAGDAVIVEGVEGVLTITKATWTEAARREKEANHER